MVTDCLSTSTDLLKDTFMAEAQPVVSLKSRLKFLQIRNMFANFDNFGQQNVWFTKLQPKWHQFSNFWIYENVDLNLDWRNQKVSFHCRG